MITILVLVLIRIAAEVFSQDRALDAVAADWIARWDQNNTEAMCDLINFVIKCTGCNLQVDVHDIEDPDNVVSKLTDLQDEYQAQKPADYPLISKAKGHVPFRSTMTSFIETLITTCHAAGLLYSDLAIIENIEVWVSTMSSSAIRPFRHTATVISLTIGNTMCKVAADISENTAKTMRQKEGEQKKKSVNKERVKALEAKIADWDRKQKQARETLQAIFDTVFVHRYRDVDPKIRVDCVSALGTWILTLPEVFFEGIYLRYLGWVLSDTFAPTRAEVIKQLTKLFKNKDNVARLRTFTERFRARLVEMAMRDSEASIRASTVDLLDLIRDTGLLEPDDIDNIGRLIFDTEPRVRNAVAGFFAENINDLYETTLEDFGGQEGLTEILGEEVEEDYDSPKASWLKLKCVAEALQSYDAEDEESTTQREADASLIATGVESRFALAAQTIYAGIPEAKEWEVLAGYLLHDLSSADESSGAPDAAFKERCTLNEREEILLLEILNVAVKARLLEAVEAEADKKGKKTKVRKDDSREIQESTALHLAQVIPQLLKKFGSDPATASAVLRLEHVLNLEIFQELRQDSTTYASLLDDISNQFLRHADQGVLVEASTALLHARSFEDLEEVTESKMQELWQDMVAGLRSNIAAGTGADPGELRTCVRRIANLASIADCVSVFDGEGRSNPKKKLPKATTASTFGLLLDLIRDPALDAYAGNDSDEILIGATKALLFYYMWTVRTLQASLTTDAPISSFPDYSPFAKALTSIIEARPSTSSVRLAASGTLLDLYTLFATFRHVQIPDQNIVQHVPAPAQALILSTYTALEKSLAKRARKTLEVAPDDDLASDPEEPSDSEDEDEDQNHQQQETLLAEKRLCELTGKMVLAIVGRVLDYEGPKKLTIKERLQRNRMKLGSNYKEVVAYLDGPKVKGKKKATMKQPVGKQMSKAVVGEGSEEEEEAQHEEGGEEDLRERELVEDRIVDADEGEALEVDAAATAEAEDEIMGD